jgi:hypothetical protein
MEPVSSVMPLGPSHFFMFNLEDDVIQNQTETAYGKAEQQTFDIKTRLSGQVEQRRRGPVFWDKKRFRKTEQHGKSTRPKHPPPDCAEKRKDSQPDQKKTE